MIVNKDTSFRGFALPHFAAEIALKPQFRALFDALKQPCSLRARDLVKSPESLGKFVAAELQVPVIIGP